MKNAGIYLILCFILILSSGFSKELINHKIDIDLQENGDASIIEDYKINIQESDDFILLNDLTINSNNDIKNWKEFFPDIDFHVLGDIKNLVISTETNAQFGSDIIIQYDIRGLAKISAEEPRRTIYSITAKDFKFYNEENNFFFMPKNTNLNIKVSPSKRLEVIQTIPRANSEVIEGAKVEKGMIKGGKLVYQWNRPLSTEQFVFSYSIDKTLGESFDIQKIGEAVFSFFIAEPIYATVFIIFILLIFIYRRQIMLIMSESFSAEEEVIPPKNEI